MHLLVPTPGPACPHRSECPSPAAPAVGSRSGRWLWRVFAYCPHCRCQPGGPHRETGPGFEYSSLPPREEKGILFGKDKQTPQISTSSKPSAPRSHAARMTEAQWKQRHLMARALWHMLGGPDVSFPLCALLRSQLGQLSTQWVQPPEKWASALKRAGQSFLPSVPDYGLEKRKRPRVCLRRWWVLLIPPLNRVTLEVLCIKCILTGHPL